MWATLLKSLADYLRDNLTDTDVVLNASAQVWEVRTVVVSRGGAEPRREPDWTGGVQRVWIECWEHASIPEDANTALDALETAVQAALADWLAALALPGVCVAGQVTAIEPDGDLFRPSVGSRLTCELRWRQD